ncbi:MAG TPA: efflux RND transporter periplasmic adaptor subunit [Candidatus Acidoferrum sp.]|jgi:membrane fusion protein (multidrug efflux system)|nr:efflux RND transporter periplasmic adaptor subunit [Candidatus Acidoferrum sp.]
MDAWAAMTHRRIVFLAAAIVALATAACFMGGCGGEQKAAAGPPNVEIATVVQKDVPIVREFVSTLTGLVNAQIRAQVSGYLVKQLYLNGAYVKKGSSLFQLDPRTFIAAVDQAAGNLAQAKADLQKAQAQLGKTQLDVDRYTPLAKTGAISQQELDDAVQANLAAKGQVAAAKASIDAGTAALESAKLNLGFATVVAPIDGVAGISNAQVGDFVGPQSTNALTTVSTVDPILANITPSEEDYLNAMKAAQKSGLTDIQILSPLVWELELTNGAIYGEKGRFYAMDRQVNIQTGTILLQIKFPNPGRVLRPGGFGNVRTVARLEKNALLVPQRAVTDIQGKYLIAVVGGDNKVSIRPVNVGEKVGTMWVITGGLHPGDQVVAEGTQKVQEGLLVNPKPFQEPAAANSTKGGLQ